MGLWGDAEFGAMEFGALLRYVTLTELMNVIITQGGKRTCTAFVGAGDVGGTSYHMQHWKKSTKTNKQRPIHSD